MMEHDRYFRIQFICGEHQMIQKFIVSIFSSTARCLEDAWGVCFLSSFHYCLDLLHIVDIKSADTVITFCSFIEEFTKFYKHVSTHTTNYYRKTQVINSTYIVFWKKQSIIWVRMSSEVERFFGEI